MFRRGVVLDSRIPTSHASLVVSYSSTEACLSVLVCSRRGLVREEGVATKYL